ncbi:hypothetical protein FALCPG4_014991 [Fusarium falciforme]
MSDFERHVKCLGCPHCGSGEFHSSHAQSHDEAVHDIPDISCPGCGDLDPWSQSSNRKKFYSVGNKENALFVRRLERKDWKAAAQFCLRCAIINAALRIAEDEAKDGDTDLIKVRINAKPGSSGLIIGPQYRKEDRIELFVPSVAKESWLSEFLPAAGRLRMIETTSSSQRCLDMLKEWLRECREGHPGCPSNNQVKLPSRVIDVGSEGQDPRIVETNSQLGEYLTLSYCWGGISNGKTVSTNLQERLVGISLHALCKTHQDAIDLTRRLGFRYLWIDALCIVQDDTADWAAEAARMWEIYRDSALTIAADSSKSGNGGIYSRRRNELVAMGAINIVEVPQRLSEDGEDKASSEEALAPAPALSKSAWNESQPGTDDMPSDAASEGQNDGKDPNDQEREQPVGGNPIKLCLEATRLLLPDPVEDSNDSDTQRPGEHLIAACTDNNDPVLIVRRPVMSHKLYSYGFHTRHTADDFPIEDRAWCFQERILSTRIAHFNRDELVWECNRGAQCECGGIVLSRRENAVGLRERFEVSAKSADVRVRCDAWMDMLCKFYSRKITEESDRLAALSGLAHCLRDEGGFGEYAAGMWRDHLPFQLLWSTYSRTNRRAVPRRAPTWSFASLEVANGVSFLLEQTFPSARKALASVTAFQCTPAGNDYAGYLANATITLMGPVQEVDMHIRFEQAKTSAADAYFLVRVGGKLRRIINDIPLLEEADVVGLQFQQPDEADATVSAKNQPNLIPCEIGDGGVRRPFDCGRIMLLAICTERQLRFKSYGYTVEALYLLVLRQKTASGKAGSGPAANASEALYERIGVLRLNKEGDNPEAWLADAQDKTLTLV